MSGAAKDCLVLVYGDSMSLPSVQDQVAVGETYPELLAQHRSALGLRTRVYSRAEGGRTIRDHWTRYSDDLRYFPAGPNDLLIIHAGMVDCAPRPLPQKWRRRLERQPGFIRKPIVAFLHNNRPWLFQRGFVFYKVDAPTFRRRMEEWLASAATRYRRVALVGISPIGQAAEDHSPGWRESVKVYNTLMAEAAARHPGIAGFIDLHASLSDPARFAACVSAADGYHLTRAGHALVRDLIVEFLENHAAS